MTNPIAELSLADLDRVAGGEGINFSATPAAAIEQVKQRAAVCRALTLEGLRQSNNQEPKRFTEAEALLLAGKACWASFEQ